MNYTKIGSTGLTISFMGLGCSKFGSALGGIDGSDAVRLIDLAIEGGINFFDTANIYGHGQSERLLGKAVNHRRDKVVIATKAGQRFSAVARGVLALKKPIARVASQIPAFANALQRRRDQPLPRCFEVRYLENELEQSLKRLKTDYVDVFYLHSPRTEHLLNGEVESFMASLKRSGKIRCWGISCDAGDDVVSLLSKASPDVLQLPYSYTLEPRTLVWCRDIVRRGGGIIVRGIVSQIQTDMTIDQKRDFELRDAWEAVQHSDHVTAALFGTTKPAHLAENLAAVNTVAAVSNRLPPISA